MEVPLAVRQRGHSAQWTSQKVDATLQGDLASPVPAEVQLATGWRRWLRRVMGHED